MDVFELDIAESTFKETALYKAVKSKRPLQVLEALKNGASVDACDPEFHTTYLHLLVSVADAKTDEKLTPIVYQLSNAGIDVDAEEYKGATALELAIRRQLPHMVTALLRTGANAKLKDYQRIIQGLEDPGQVLIQDVFDRYDPGLWAAVESGDPGMVHVLVNSWCRINISRDGRTLMELARQSRQADELLSILDDFQVTMEFVHATLAGDTERMLEFLMDSKPCDPYIMDISHQHAGSSTLSPRSLREAALHLDHLHTLDYLPKDDLDIDNDVKGYFGGMTLAEANKVASSQARMTTDQNDSSQKTIKDTHRTNESRTKKTKSSKCKPMKALIPYHANRTSSSSSGSQTPDVTADHSPTDPEAFTQAFDKLSDSLFGEDDRTYERSRLTGSVALRSKTKSRKSVISAYCVQDPADTSHDYDGQTAATNGLDRVGSSQGTISFRGMNMMSNPRDYDKTWKRSSLRSSMGHSKSRSKEIISKLCVIA